MKKSEVVRKAFGFTLPCDECKTEVDIEFFSFFAAYVVYHNALPNGAPLLREHGIALYGICGDCGRFKSFPVDYRDLGEALGSDPEKNFKAFVHKKCEEYGKKLLPKVRVN